MYNTIGYKIVYDEKISKNPKAIIIAMHGFAGDRFSGCIELLKKKCFLKNYGIINFDWPAHGESPVNGDFLTLPNCINDINVIVNDVKLKYLDVPIIAFSTSFGGYVTLLYNKMYPNNFNHIILRAPAIEMYNVLLENIMTKKNIDDLTKLGYFEYGFDRKIKITDKFVNELHNNDIFSMYENIENNSKICIIHGDMDNIVPISTSKKFSSLYGCYLKVIHGADHRFKKTGELENIVTFTLNYLDNKIN